MLSRDARAIRKILLSHDLTATDFKIYLFLIDHAGTITSLCDDLNLKQPTAAASVARLRKIGLIREVAQVGRSKILVAEFGGNSDG